MTAKDLLHVEKVDWASVKPTVARLAPALADTLDAALKKAVLYKATYQYGELIVANGKFQTPSCNGLGAPCVRCRELIGVSNYASIPLGLVLTKCVEVHLVGEGDQRVFTAPLRIIQAGGFIGVFESMGYYKKLQPHSSPPWNVSAGARSIYVMAHLDNEKEFYNPLRRLIRGEPLKQLPRWPAFGAEDSILVREIARHANLRFDVEVLLFPQAVAENIWKRVDSRALLLDVYEEQSRHLVAHATEDAMFHLKHQHTNDHYTRTVMHILRIARGDLPGFRPVLSSKGQAGPFVEVQRWILGNLAQWAPSDKPFPAILQPVHLLEAGSSCFYSFYRPSLLVRPPMLKSQKKPMRPRSAVDVMEKLMDGLQQLGQEEHYLDLDKTISIDTSTQMELNPAAFIPEEFSARLTPTQAEGRTGIADPHRAGASFFTGAIKIVRK